MAWGTIQSVWWAREIRGGSARHCDGFGTPRNARQWPKFGDGAVFDAGQYQWCGARNNGRIAIWHNDDDDDDYNPKGMF